MRDRSAFSGIPPDGPEWEADRPYLHPFCLLAWFVFVALLPLSRWIDLLLGRETTSATSLALVLCFVVILGFGNLLGRLPPGPLWGFGAYVLVVAASYPFVDVTLRESAFYHLYQLVLMCMCFWLAYQVGRRYEYALWTMVVLAGSSLVLGAMSLNPGTSKLVAASTRVTVQGYNANHFACYIATSITLLAAFALEYPHRSFVLSGLCAAGIALQTWALLQSGSRGQTVAVLPGLLVLALGMRHHRMLRIGLTLSGLVVALFMWHHSALGTNVLRWQQASAGDLAGREFIYPEAVRMFREKPWLGWLPAHNECELAGRVGARSVVYSTHNSLLGALTEVGVVGAAGYVVGLVLCGIAAWRARTGPIGVTTLALYAAVVASQMPSDMMEFHLHWLVLGLVYAAPQWRPEAPLASDASRPGEGQGPWHEEGTA
jgi:O-antigen ligase